MLPCLRIALSPREATLCRWHKMPERLSTSCVSKTRRIALWRLGRPVGPKDRDELERGMEVFQRRGLETQVHSRGLYSWERMGVV